MKVYFKGTFTYFENDHYVKEYSYYFNSKNDDTELIENIFNILKKEKCIDKNKILKQLDKY